MSRPARARKLLSDMQLVKRDFGKSYASQLSEILRLRLGDGKLGVTEYYFYGLYDDSRYSFDDKRQFLGWRMQGPVDACVPQEWWITVEDKLLLYGYLHGLGFPVPELYGLFHRFRRHGALAALRDRDDVASFLARGCTYPFFAKPNHAGCARGVLGVQAYDPGSRTLTCINGERMSLDAFLRDAEEFADHGYLFQQLLSTHPDLLAICGDRLTSVRVVVTVTRDGPRIVRAAWRVPAGKNMADNFSLPGNLMAGIDVDTGRVERVVTGIGTEQKDVVSHPESGACLPGVILPQWAALEDLCLQAAAALPGVLIQGWDIALCAQGPVVIESNIAGDFDLPQMANARGLLTPDFRSFLQGVGVLA